ncbi:MAG: RNA-binding transcriptional accessory protein [Bacteroidetes bacterium]|nr:RNA-binding transcriptional accessory protein [Bacteroidota bacterium]
MFARRIADTLKMKEWQVQQVLRLTDQGATIPFIARYRKEKTGNMDEVELRNVVDLYADLQELEKRRTYILTQIQEQGKLTPELKQALQQAVELQQLEDLYLPFKPRRRTRADVAREAGYESLAQAMFAQKGDAWLHKWEQMVPDPAVGKAKALENARDIVAEWISEDAALRAKCRRMMEDSAVLHCRVTRGKATVPEAQKYRDYFDHREKLMACPSHRFLAICRGENEGWLKMQAECDGYTVKQLLKRHCLRGYGDTQDQIQLAMTDAWDRLLHPSLESELFDVVRKRAEEEAIAVFAANVKQLLLAPPLGEKALLALDPGFRTGCKLVALDANGNLLAHETIFPHEPQRQTTAAANLLRQWVEKYKPAAIAIGNGTAGRETETFCKSVSGLDLPVYMVNEAGASVYSASEVARQEFPDKDVTVRGAVSIGRRLMDPLAELVKIDPKSIGVGQYQHDVSQVQLKKRLNEVVESAVNAVGVNLNTASAWLLERVSGLGPVLAKNIVEYRQVHGPFRSRRQLADVPRLGDKAFEQCAGFLRIRNAGNPLDNSAVHPERYPLVQKMAADMKMPLEELLRDPEKADKIPLDQYISESEGVGLPTLKDIVHELKKPGLDPRGDLLEVGFSDSVRKISDLEPGLELKGVITNITDFGAFVDIGVKQDGLVHVSQLSRKFVKHPLEVVSLGQHVTVRVMDVDAGRKRISLTMKFDS